MEGPFSLKHQNSVDLVKANGSGQVELAGDTLRLVWEAGVRSGVASGALTTLGRLRLAVQSSEGFDPQPDLDDLTLAFPGMSHFLHVSPPFG